MTAPVPRGFDPLAPDPSPLPAGTHKPEPNPPEGVAADAAVVDAEGDPSYRDGVHYGSRALSDDTRRPPLIEAAGVPPLTEPDRSADALREHERQSEDERQAWLRRVQAER